MKRFINKLKRYFEPHWVIIGYHTKEVIGCCSGKEGRAIAMSQEPGCAFKRVSRCKCPSCNEEE